MLKIASTIICVSLVAASPALSASSSPARSASPDVMPDFSTDSLTGWVKTPGSDEFIPPASGPGPVQADRTRPYVSHGHPGDGGNPDGQETVKIADITNPILQPWAVEQMKKANEQVLAGEVGFTARARCWPSGVPGFLTYPVFPIYFIQSPKVVLMMWGGDSQTSLRRVHLNVLHSRNPAPSWYGESVGHYENGDTLVIDTIGFVDHPLSFVDNYRTPHTKDLHVVERWKIVEGGSWLEVNARIEDRAAFTTPWNVVQRYRRVDKEGPPWEEGPIKEMVCAETSDDPFDQGLVPIPQDDMPDF